MVDKKIKGKSSKIKKSTKTKIKKLPRKRLDGVDFDRIWGAKCPGCHLDLGSVPGGSVTNTLPWEDGVRIRYHTCTRCGKRFKSIEEI